MEIQYICAVTLAVRDMTQSVEFYRKLGLELAYGGKDSDFTSFRAGRDFINLCLTAEPVRSRWGRVILRATDVDSLHGELRAKGFTPQAPRDGAWGERYFHLKDPDGHELSFAQLLS